MSAPKWSAPIPVTGRPEWLADDVPCLVEWAGSGWYGTYAVPPYIAQQWEWSDGLITAIRVPSDHPAAICRGWNDTHPEKPPFAPWCGGEHAPDDWAGVCLLRGGVIWEHPDADWTHKPGCKYSDIVGYRRKSRAVVDPEPLCTPLSIESPSGHSKLLPLLRRCWESPLTTRSDYARQNPEDIAQAACLGLITVRHHNTLNEWGRHWRITSSGLQILENTK